MKNSNKVNIGVIKFNYFIVSLILFSASVSLMPVLNFYALFILLPLLFIYNLLFFNPFTGSKSIRLLTVLFIWIVISFLFAENKALGIKNIQEIFGGIILCYIMYSLTRNKRYLPWLYLSFVLYYASLWVFVYQKGLLLIDFQSQRLNDDMLNANTLAYFNFYNLIAIFMLGEIVKNSTLKNILEIVYFAMIILTPIVSVVASSRQILYTTVPLSIIFLIYRYGIRFSLRRVVRISILLIIGFFIYENYLVDFFSNSFLQARLEESVGDDPRAVALKEALVVGAMHPVFGVGPANFTFYSSDNIFSHNSYSELFATSGLLSMILYLWIIIKFLRDQISRFTNTKSKIFLYFFIIGIFWAFANVFYVYYHNLWLLSFLFLLIGHSDMYYNSSKDIGKINVLGTMKI